MSIIWIILANQLRSNDGELLGKFIRILMINKRNKQYEVCTNISKLECAFINYEVLSHVNIEYNSQH